MDGMDRKQSFEYNKRYYFNKHLSGICNVTYRSQGEVLFLL